MLLFFVGCCWEGVVVYVSALFLWVLFVGMCLLWFVCMLVCKFVGMLVSIASALFYVYACMYVCMYCFCFVLYVCLYVGLYVCLWVGRVFCWGLSLSSWCTCRHLCFWFRPRRNYCSGSLRWMYQEKTHINSTVFFPYLLIVIYLPGN